MLRFKTADGPGELHAKVQKIDGIKSIPRRLRRLGESPGAKAELLVGGIWHRIDEPLVDVLVKIAAATPAPACSCANQEREQ